MGFDANPERIAELRAGRDRTGELTLEQLKEAPIRYSDEAADIKEADIVIVAVPTPVDAQNLPDLRILKNASETIGKNLKKGAIVVYESTVYPGVTEEVCGPILEEQSGMHAGIDFFLGYSPERINPGDKEHTVEKIVKIVAGQNEKIADTLCDLYGSIITAGIHRAPSIKVAEMAKAIENAQRDLNIAYVNEVAKLCAHIGIASKDVLEAASTKWNFLQFQPGLVGGHCIGVDPYYLVEKAKQLGMNSEVITAGRSVNDGMPMFVVQQLAKHMPLQAKKALVLGLTFKENVPDTRNSKSFDVIHALQQQGADVYADDPHASEEDMKRCGCNKGSLKSGSYDIILLLVAHNEYRELSESDFVQQLTPDGIFYDLKCVKDKKNIEEAGKKYMCL